MREPLSGRASKKLLVPIITTFALLLATSFATGVAGKAVGAVKCAVGRKRAGDPSPKAEAISSMETVTEDDFEDIEAPEMEAAENEEGLS